MYVESAPGASGFPEHLRTQSWQQRVSAGGNGPGGEMQVSMGADAPSGPSGLSPADTARILQQNMLMQQNAHNDEKQTRIVMGVGAVLVLALGFVIYKATRD